MDEWYAADPTDSRRTGAVYCRQMPRRRVIVPDGSIPLAEPIDHRSLMLLGTAPRPFRSADYAWELKYDGFRMLAFRDRAGARLMTRSGRDASCAFPEVVESLLELKGEFIIDAELTVPDLNGRPDWHALRSRAFMTRAQSIRAARHGNPAILYAFDLLALNGRDARPCTLVARRKVLEDAVGSHGAVAVSELWDDGVALLMAAEKCYLEGVVGKRLASPYVAGRSRDWVKVRASTARPQERR